MNVSFILTDTNITIWARDATKVYLPPNPKIKIKIIETPTVIWDSLRYLNRYPPKKPYIFLPMKSTKKASRVHADTIRLNYPDQNIVAISGKPFEVQTQTGCFLISHIDMERVCRLLALPIKVARGYGKKEEYEALGITRQEIMVIPERALIS